MRRPGRSITMLLVTSFLWLIAGCRLPGGQSPALRYWVLEPTSVEAGSETAPIRVEVGPFAFPGYLKRTQYVERVGERQLRVSTGDRWGEPLDRAFGEVLAKNLSRSTPGVSAFVRSSPDGRSPELHLTGSVARFEVVSGPDRDREAQLEVSWTLDRVSDGEVVASGQGTHRIPVDTSGADAGVAGMSACLASLSREITDALGAVHQEP